MSLPLALKHVNERKVFLIEINSLRSETVQQLVPFDPVSYVNLPLFTFFSAEVIETVSVLLDENFR